MYIWEVAQFISVHLAVMSKTAKLCGHVIRYNAVMQHNSQYFQQNCFET